MCMSTYMYLRIQFCTQEWDRQVEDRTGDRTSVLVSVRETAGVSDTMQDSCNDQDRKGCISTKGVFLILSVLSEWTFPSSRFSTCF